MLESEMNSLAERVAKAMAPAIGSHQPTPRVHPQIYTPDGWHIALFAEERMYRYNGARVVEKVRIVGSCPVDCNGHIHSHTARSATPRCPLCKQSWPADGRSSYCRPLPARLSLKV